MIVESFYAELMSDSPLQDDPTTSELFGNGLPMPVHMMPQDKVLFTAHGDDDDQVQRGHALLDEEVYIDHADDGSEDGAKLYC